MQPWKGPPNFDDRHPRILVTNPYRLTKSLAQTNFLTDCDWTVADQGDRRNRCGCSRWSNDTEVVSAKVWG